MTDDPKVVPVLTSDTPMLSRIIGQTPVVNGNGTINLRKTHPNRYFMMMLGATISTLLGINFFAFTPTFFVYDRSNYLWASVFLALGVSQIIFLNLYRNMDLVRFTLACSVGYVFVFGIGTMQPALEGNGSLQLPILYFGHSFLLFAVLIEPFINPWTAKSDS